MFKYKRHAKKARLSIAPLLDMIFILLIFFVVSTTFSKLPGVLINRPEATTTDKLPPNNLFVGITKQGQYFINKQEYQRDALKEKLTLKHTANPRLSVVIVADKDSSIKHAVTVMDICKQIGIQDVAIAEEMKQ